MEKNGYTRLSQVQEHYTTRVLKIVKDLGLKPIGTNPIFNRLLKTCKILADSGMITIY
jgi:hypothetical protein